MMTPNYLKVVEQYGRIDIVVNNAGQALLANIAETARNCTSYFIRIYGLKRCRPKQSFYISLSMTFNQVVDIPHEKSS